MISTDRADLVIIPKASIRPNKIVFYTQVFRHKKNLETLNPVLSPEVKKDLQAMGVPVKCQPLSNTHNFCLSDKAKTRIRQKVSWLYSLAKNNSVTSASGKTLFAFKMNFLTLTLPSHQEHSTSDITSICLNQFLTECKSRFNMQNYVWRLEFQENGNAHYHIATDCFLEYFQAKTIWNRCLNKLGYVDRYAAKMSKMSFSSYSHLYSNNGKNSEKVLKQRFSLGTAQRWEQPNTVDVRAVSNAKNISFYISKYITKDSATLVNKTVLLREPNTTNLRMWFCSRSLSRLDKIECFIEEIDSICDNILNNVREVAKYVYDYVTVWYFDLQAQSFPVKASLWELYNKYARSVNYVAWKPLKT